MNSEQCRERAAEWFFRLRSAEVKPTEVQEWIAWCDASPENKQEFSRMQAIWQQSGALPKQDLDSIAPLSRSNGWALAAGIALVSVLGALWWGYRMSIPTRGTVTFATSTGVNRDIRLPDGSAVILAAGSRLTTHYTQEMRHIALESGEAFFQVRKDPSRPFTVRALNATVTAVGTTFNVRAEQGVVKVAVTEGAVDVEHEAPGPAREQSRIENIRIGAGRQITFAPTNSKPIVLAVDAERAAAWRSGTLQFVREPLSSVVAAVNRYAVTPIELRDEELGRYNYTGTVAADRVDEWLRGLPDIYPVRVREQGKDSIVIEPVHFLKD